MAECPFTRKIFIFQDLRPEEVEEVVQHVTLHEFPPKAVIIREGDEGDGMFIMCQGEVEITKNLTLQLAEETPKSRVMARLRAEDGVSFGEMALLEHDVRSATVTALSPCTMMQLGRDDFLRLVNDNPEMGVKILVRLSQLLSRHLRKTDQEVVKLTTALVVALGG